MDHTHSALIVAVPEAEPVVARHRERLDSAAAWGVPAHVTVLYPFLAPAEIDGRVVETLRRVVAGVPAFRMRLAGPRWFGENVLWLAPEPAGPFRQLTAAVTARFAGVQPYGGQFDEVVPHLTVGHDHPLAELTAAAEDVRPHLPIHATVTAVRLITGRPEPGSRWPVRAELALG